MLKIKNVEFIDKNNQTYLIKYHQIETFPLIGGEEGNMVNTQIWNQHGNTHIKGYMQSFMGEMVFMIYTEDKTADQIENARRQIINICNPLNGLIKMKITLNNEKTYFRDITFLTAPLFPVGLENRNEKWQKVQILYEANNPFWYSETEIIESFKSIEPNFYFPFTMSTTEPIIFGTVIPANIAKNIGQVEAPVTIKIIGACTNPMIENKTTGDFIKFKNLIMGENQELLIDTTFGQKRILLDGENAFNKLDYSSTFFNLIIGENIIEFTDDTGTASATIYFIYRNLYISI